MQEALNPKTLNPKLKPMSDVPASDPTSDEAQVLDLDSGILDSLDGFVPEQATDMLGFRV